MTSRSPTPSQYADAHSGPVPVPVGVRVASILCWIVGILSIFVAFAIGIPAVAIGGSLVLPALSLLVGAMVCVAAVLIRRQRKIGVLLMVVAWVIPTVLASFSKQSARGSLVLIVVLLLVAANWKHLR